MPKEFLKHTTKKKANFQRIFSLFRLARKPWSLFFASLMKVVLYIKGSLLRSYQLQDQPQLSSVNDYQVLFPLRDEASSSVLFRGSRPRDSCVGLTLQELSGGRDPPRVWIWIFSVSLSYLACLLHAVQSSVFQSFSVGMSFLRIGESIWGMKEWQEDLRSGDLSSKVGQVPDV